MNGIATCIAVNELKVSDLHLNKICQGKVWILFVIVTFFMHENFI